MLYTFILSYILYLKYTYKPDFINEFLICLRIYYTNYEKLFYTNILYSVQYSIHNNKHQP